MVEAWQCQSETQEHENNSENMHYQRESALDELLGTDLRNVTLVAGVK
jgi:hypothetical protein